MSTKRPLAPTAGEELKSLRKQLERSLRRRMRIVWSLPFAGVAILAWWAGVTVANDVPSNPLPLQPEPPRVVLPHEAFAAPPGARIHNWRLAWDDEFRTAADLRKWNLLKYAYPYNGQLEDYQPANDRVVHHALELVAFRKAGQGRQYTSGMVTTQARASFLYGKIVVRAKLVSGKGFLPAIWLLPEGGRTSLPELDVLEELGSFPHVIWMTDHWRTKGGRVGTLHRKYSGPDFSTGYHNFGLTWTPKEITWTIDGSIKDTLFDHIPHVPMYLLMNVAIGGSWPGSPDAQTKFPQAMWVKFVRVYQADKAALR